jgi:hypothetical protein
MLHPGDLMKSDLLSEILLVGSGLILFVPVLMIIVLIAQSGLVR